MQGVNLLENCLFSLSNVQPSLPEAKEQSLEIAIEQVTTTGLTQEQSIEFFAFDASLQAIVACSPIEKPVSFEWSSDRKYSIVFVVKYPWKYSKESFSYIPQCYGCISLSDIFCKAAKTHQVNLFSCMATDTEIQPVITKLQQQKKSEIHLSVSIQLSFQVEKEERDFFFLNVMSVSLANCESKDLIELEALEFDLETGSIGNSLWKSATYFPSNQNSYFVCEGKRLTSASQSILLVLKKLQGSEFTPAYFALLETSSNPFRWIDDKIHLSEYEGFPQTAASENFLRVKKFFSPYLNQTKLFLQDPSDEFFSNLKEVQISPSTSNAIFSWIQHKERTLEFFKKISKHFDRKFLFQLLKNQNSPLYSALDPNRLAEIILAETSSPDFVVQLFFNQSIPIELFLLLLPMVDRSVLLIDEMRKFPDRVEELLNATADFDSEFLVSNGVKQLQQQGSNLSVLVPLFISSQELSNRRRAIQILSGNGWTATFSAFLLLAHSKFFTEARDCGEKILLTKKKLNLANDQLNLVHRELAEIYGKGTQCVPTFSYFLVSFNGVGFPKLLRGNSFIVEFEDSVSLASTLDLFVKAFPHSSVGSHSLGRNPTYQSISIASVSPLSATNISFYSNSKGCSLFQYTTVSQSNQAIKVLIQTKAAFPNASGVARVDQLREFPLTCVHFAIKEVSERNISISRLLEASLDNTSNREQLRMLTIGGMFAGCNGGAAVYRDTFLDGSYEQDHPKDRSLLRRLAILLREHEALLAKAGTILGIVNRT